MLHLPNFCRETHSPKMWNCIKISDDILIGETSPEKVGEKAAAVWQAVNKAEIEIPSGKYLGLSKEEQTLSVEIGA